MITDLNLILVLATAVILLLVFYLIKPKQFLTIVRQLRFTRIIHYIGMAVGGFVLGYRQFHITEPPDILAIAGVVVVGLFSFQSAVFLNDYFDVEIDLAAKMATPLSVGAITPKLSLILSVITGLLSLSFALTLNPAALIFILIFHILSVIYSAPPLRVKRFYPLSIFTIALWAWVIMLSGFAVWAGAKTLSLFPLRMTALVIITLTLAFGTKDAKDIAGDRSEGIITLFTLLGEKCGSLVNGILVLISYLLAPLILNYPKLYFIAVPCAILSVLACLRKRINETFIFFIYYIFGLSILGLIITGKLFGS